jgi:beta-1,4-mannosyl-glycoprotein beta-1,4-N-acetylglucosaminyltransferase
MKASIIIPTSNHLEACLRPCIDGIRHFTEMSAVEVLVIANGCRDDTVEFVSSLGPPWKLIELEQPAGFVGAVNEGLRAASGELVVLFNDDAVLVPQPVNQWLDYLLGPLHDPRVGATGPLLITSSETGLPYVSFFCAATRRALINRIGLLDEQFSPGFGEDVDWCMRATAAGYQVVQVPDAHVRRRDDRVTMGKFPIRHRGGSTFGDSPEITRVRQRNSNILTSRYGKVIRLNLGCGSQRIKGYVGVDLDSSAGSAADLQMDPRKLELFKDNSVDEILADHLFQRFSPYEAEGILKERKRALKPGGKLILEVPDILELCRQFDKQGTDGRYRLLAGIYGNGRMEESHRFGWYKETLTGHLAGAGFVEPRFVPPQARRPYPCIGVEAIKPRVRPRQRRSLGEGYRIYDCFPFFNELELLDIRLSELDAVVDKFVLVESRQTHSGVPKPLYFEENKERFSRFLPKIVHVILDSFPVDDVWGRERYQRTQILRGLASLPCSDDDVIISTDADEIASAAAVRRYRPEDGLMTLDMPLFYYYFNCLAGSWDQAKILPYGLLKQLTPCGARYSGAPLLSKGGWHFTYMGGPDRIIRKIESWAHQEYNQPQFKNKETVEAALKRGVDLFGLRASFKFVEIDDDFPDAIRSRKQSWIDRQFIRI